MIKKLVLTFAVIALAVASAAGTAPIASASYKVTLLQPSVVNGNALKAGDYRLNVVNEKVTIMNGKSSIEVPVKVESVEKKFDNTAVRYNTVDGKASIAEIRIGGTKTKLVFNQ